MIIAQGTNNNLCLKHDSLGVDCRVLGNEYMAAIIL